MSPGGDMVSVQHWAGPETSDPAQILLHAAEARTRLAAFWNVLNDQMHTSANIYPAETAILVSSTPPGVIPLSPPTAIPGVLTGGDPLPWMTQGVITLRTGEATRRGRGRIFIPYLCETVNTAGVPTTGMLTVMNAAADELAIAHATTFALNLVVYHRDTGLATNVGTAAARPYWAFLSSRRK